MARRLWMSRQGSCARQPDRCRKQVKRHQRPPEGATSRYKPRPSNSRYGFSRGLALTISACVTGMAPIPLETGDRLTGSYDQLPPRSQNRLSCPRNAQADESPPIRSLKHQPRLFLRKIKRLGEFQRSEANWVEARRARGWWPRAESNHRHADFQSYPRSLQPLRISHLRRLRIRIPACSRHSLGTCWYRA